MTEERRPRTISTMPRLSPEDVANRAFATSFRGYAEAEVRSFLKRISEELTAMRDREQELLSAVDDLESRLAAPRPLDEKELLDALGEETTRLLRNAREAADDIRQKSEERAARVVEDAQAEAQRMRHEASEILAVRTTEAEAAATEIQRQTDERVNDLQASAERYHEEQRLRAEQEADALVENARTQGRQMVEEAKALRERVLADLARRRGLLQAQLEELRNGRDHLLEAYRVVKRTFLEATEALAQAEARAASGAPLPAAAVADVEDEATDEPATDDDVADAPVEVVTESEVVAVVDVVATVDGAIAPAHEGDAAVSVPGAPLPDVDSLFARIRAGAEPAPGVEEAVADVEARTSADAADAAETVAAEVPSEPAAPERAEPADDTREPWRTRASETVAPLVAPLVKQAKRAAQDEQNALLDALRRHKGQPTSEQVLQSGRDSVTAWSAVLRGGLDTAYGAGRRAVGSDAVAAPPDLTEEAVRHLVEALRERLAVAIDDDNDGFSTSLVIERIGARYREWKLQALDGMVEDVLITAWSRGVYDAAPDGALLQWVSAHEGRCPDCDDNALEPTVKGESFPTGQLYPPAHPGCRCVLALAGVAPNVP
jgi:DivIVA domain-containing protein